MRRREFIGTVGGIALAAPSSGFGQRPAMPVIGMLCSASPELWEERLRAFRQGLDATGYVEGRNVEIDYRWAHGDNGRLPGLAVELVRRNVSVIVVLGTAASAFAAKASTTTIPIVVRGAANPVEIGLVPSLSRPGGNITGVTTLGVEVAPKQVELLHELLPDVRTFALLINPSNPAVTTTLMRSVPAATGKLGLALRILKASSDAEIDAAFADPARSEAGALLVGADTFFNSRNERIAKLSIQHKMPAASPYHEFAAAGGLMGYGGSVVAASRDVGVYVGRILKGEKPGDLPFQQTTAIGLTINVATARILNLKVPHTILARANELIE